MTMRNLLLIGSVAVSMGLIGCNQDGQSGANQQVLSELNGSQGQGLTTLKVSLDQATLEQVSDYVFECHGNKLCVQICHRPPGDPTNSKTMLLPLAATKTHLHHGGDTHDEKDYLGTCDVEDGGSVDGAVDAGADTSTSVDSGTGTDANVDTGTGIAPGEEVPLWCQSIVELDSNCDGFDDSTGQALLQ
ncbi:MAG: hypothetical protein BroJett040_00330 [Oligoflexia bacterium]|nr:MAG: hypothetical protein BroJett040_00330 [Oligoflexia bacterium]